MKKKILLLTAAFLCLMNVHAINEIVVDDANVLKGGKGTIKVRLNNDKAYTAFSMKIDLPTGLTLESVTKGNRMAESHSLSCNTTTNMITCLSTANDTFTGDSGVLFYINVSASNDLEIGNELDANLSEINFSTTSGEESLENASFKINITDCILFDENDEILPNYAAGEKNKVSMKRTIKANTWSTIVLPFTLTKAKAEAAFGNDVELAEFTGFVVNYGNDEENTIPLSITINLSKYVMTSKKGMKGGKPFFIKTSSDIAEFQADEVTMVNAVTDDNLSDEFETPGKFTGTLVKSKIPEDGLFINNNQFWYSTGKTNVKAFRCWFELGAVLDKETTFDSRIFLHFDDNETTIIHENGRMINDDRYYDLQGRQINKPAKKGFYIKNGKKEFVK